MHMMVRWMCGVSLKDRKHGEVLYNVQSFGYSEERCGRLRWFGHLEHKSGNDWVSAYRNVAGVKFIDKGGARISRAKPENK